MLPYANILLSGESLPVDRVLVLIPGRMSPLKLTLNSRLSKFDTIRHQEKNYQRVQFYFMDEVQN